MHEERHPGDFPEEGRSSARPVLIAAGIILGIVVLVCGGVVGHVAWTDAHRAADEVKNRETSPTRADEILRKIVKIDVPAGLVPLDSDDRGQMRRIIFGRKSAEGFRLHLAKVNFSMSPPTLSHSATPPILN